ncbi:MAG: helix-turn-helix transcriptional regulator [Lachnospiraceae bacterium]|nr:helix-turn-helix transcriptional regulator [Lachnospiraceae bacterium]
MSKPELAAALNVSSQNLYNKLKKDDFKESDMEKIADVLGCKLDVTLELNDTGDKF